MAHELYAYTTNKDQRETHGNVKLTISDGLAEGEGYSVESRFTKSFVRVDSARSGSGASRPGCDIDVVFP